MKRYFRTYIDPARRHPFLLVSSGDIRATAKRVFGAKEPVLTRALSGLSRVASPDPREPAHAGGDAQARATLNAAYLAALYGAAGKGRQAAEYARRARKGLLAYAEMGVPAHSPLYGWLTHLYLVDLALAYDLVWDAVDWSPEEREALRSMLYTDMDRLVGAVHSKHISNHSAWPMCRVITTAALFGDERLVRECLDGPDSYPVRLAHEFFDDGINYEQSTTVYQDFSVEPNVITALAARGCGAKPDPLRLKVANELSLAFRGGTTGEYDMPFYPVDSREFPRPETKDLHLAVAAKLGLLRPDTTCPSMGDYGGPSEPSSESWLTELAWDLFGDRRAARLLAMGSRKGRESHIFDPHFLTLVFGKPLPAKAAFPVKSLIYPQAGYAVLRSVEGDRFWGSDAITAVVKFGPFGNGHGHADKLHVDLSGAGKKTCIEELERGACDWRYWNSTVSHNTVAVGGMSQPGNEEMFSLNDSCGRLLFRRFSPKVKIASVEAPDVYPAVRTYRRTIAVTNSYVLDIFEVEAKKPVTFDWFLHGKGTLSVAGVRLGKGRFGLKSQGYEFFKDVRAGDAPGPVKARFSEGHTIFVAGEAKTRVFAAVGPWREGAGRPAFVVRREGMRTVFVAVHDPSGRSVTGVDATNDGRGLTVAVMGRGYADRFEVDFDALDALGGGKKRSKAGFPVLYSSKGIRS